MHRNNAWQQENDKAAKAGKPVPNDFSNTVRRPVQQTLLDSHDPGDQLHLQLDDKAELRTVDRDRDLAMMNDLQLHPDSTVIAGALNASLRGLQKNLAISPAIRSEPSLRSVSRDDSTYAQSRRDLAGDIQSARERPLFAVFDRGDISPVREGGLKVASRVQFEEGLPRIVSQHAVVIDGDSGTPRFGSGQTKVPYTPSVYHEGIWANDPRVGTTLPPFSPSPATDEYTEAPVSGSSAVIFSRNQLDRLIGSLRQQSDDQFMVLKDRQMELLETLYDRQMHQNEALKARENMLFRDITATIGDRIEDVLRSVNARIDACFYRFDCLEAMIRGLPMAISNAKPEYGGNHGNIGHEHSQSGSKHLDPLQARKEAPASNNRPIHSDSMLINDVQDQMPMNVLQSDGHDGFLNARRPRPTMMTTCEGSPIRISAKHRIELEQLGFGGSPGLGIDSREESSSGPRTPSPQDQVFTRPVIEGPNGVHYEMPDFMLENEGLVRSAKSESKVEAAHEESTSG